jgi:hypothetical protein
MSHASLIFVAAVVFATASTAAEPPPFTKASAVWTAAGHVALSVTWDGGACEKPGEATVETTQTALQADEVTIPTVSTAEVCTMQVVPVEFTGEIAVEPLTENLAVTVLAPDGSPKAAGIVPIEKTAKPAG